MAARGQLQNVVCVQKLLNLILEIIQILESHSPRYGDVQVFLKVSLNFKMAATNQLHNFCGANTQKFKS